VIERRTRAVCPALLDVPDRDAADIMPL